MSEFCEFFIFYVFFKSSSLGMYYKRDFLFVCLFVLKNSRMHLEGATETSEEAV